MTWFPQKFLMEGFPKCSHIYTYRSHYLLFSSIGNRTFLVVNNSGLMKLAQMYEFIAEGPQEKKRWVHVLGSTNSQILLQLNVHKCSWEEAIKRAMIGQEDLLSPELPSSPVGNEFPGGRLPLGLSSLTSHLNPRGSTRPRISHSSVYWAFMRAFMLFLSTSRHG